MSVPRQCRPCSSLPAKSPEAPFGKGNHPAVDTMTPRRGKDLGATASLLPVPSRRTGDLFASGTLPTRENTKATCFRGWCQVRHNSLVKGGKRAARGDLYTSTKKQQHCQKID